MVKYIDQLNIKLGTIVFDCMSRKFGGLFVNIYLQILTDDLKFVRLLLAFRQIPNKSADTIYATIEDVLTQFNLIGKC